MSHLIKRLSVVLFVCQAVLVSMPVSGLASENGGTITLQLQYEDAAGRTVPMQTGEVCIFSVNGSAGEEADADLAEALLLKLQEERGWKDTALQTKKVCDGSVTFGDEPDSLLPDGQYLLVQTMAGEAHYGFRPLLVNIPDSQGNRSITAFPKLGILKDDTSGEKEDSSGQEREQEQGKGQEQQDRKQEQNKDQEQQDREQGKDQVSGQSRTRDGNAQSAGVNASRALPQTGQLWWPVPVMLLAAGVLILIGRKSGSGVNEDDREE